MVTDWSKISVCAEASPDANKHSPSMDLMLSLSADSCCSLYLGFPALKTILPLHLRVSLGNISELECGPMPNLMVALPNIGGALCSTPQSLADAHY